MREREGGASLPCNIDFPLVELEVPDVAYQHQGGDRFFGVPLRQNRQFLYQTADSIASLLLRSLKQRDSSHLPAICIVNHGKIRSSISLLRVAVTVQIKF